MIENEGIYKVEKSLPLVKRLFCTYICRYWKGFALAIFLLIISAGTTASMAKLMEPMIDKVFTNKDETMLWPVAIGIFVVFALRGFSTYGYSVLLNKYGQRIISDINNDLFKHLVKADLKFFEETQSGQLVSRFISDTVILRSYVVESILGIAKNLFTIIALVSVMIYQDWKLSIASLVVFPVVAGVVGKLGKRLRNIARDAQSKTGDLSSILSQSFLGIKHIKSYVTEDYESDRVKDIIERIYKLMCKSFRTSALTSPLSETLSGVAIVTIVVYGGYQVFAGVSTAGKLFSFITALLLAFDPMKNLAKLTTSIQIGLAAADRLFSLIDIEPSIKDNENAKVLDIANPSISFNNVCFSYIEDKAALSDISFNVPAGKTVALVGGSGSGKSTILKLIPRFYDVSSGAIIINNDDIRDVTLKSLRQNIALVSQEVAIFNDSVKANIAYGCGNVTDEEIIEAAKAAVAHDFIQELPQGYNTIVGENGVTLSGGQKQRVSIARAMLKNAPILLLDEATSALDTTSEKQVQEALEKLQKGKTTIVVAHRLSTIINADVIYVMKEGKIVESGTHADLLDNKNEYANLYGNLVKEVD